MKAKIYAARITGIPDPDTQKVLTELGKVGKDFYNEFIDVKKERNVQYDNSFFALVYEFDKKFEKFASLVNEKHPNLVRPSGFLEILKQFTSSDMVPYIDGPYSEYKQGRL